MSNDIILDVPFVPTDNKKVKLMVKLANIKSGQQAADLGSGDGRLVIALAQAGAKADGYEIEPSRVVLARQNIAKKNLTDRARIFEKSFWETDLSEYDVIVLYGLTSIMKRLEKKLLKELKPGAKVVSNYFEFPNWEPTKEENDIFVYER